MAVAIVSAFFLAFPAIDLWASGLFYREDGGFFLRGDDALQAFRNTNRLAIIGIVVWLFVQLAIKLARPEHPSYVPPKVTFFLLSTLIAGPLLLVNMLLKNTWGRPRPTTVDVFGGDLPYVEAWHITDHCATNCSFVSGETSSAVWLIALALVVPRRFRLPVALITVTFAVLQSLNRMAFGGHFLSDVLISAGLTLLVVAVGYRLFITDPPPWLANDRLEAGLTEFGLRLHGRAARDT